MTTPAQPGWQQPAPADQAATDETMTVRQEPAEAAPQVEPAPGQQVPQQPSPAPPGEQPSVQPSPAGQQAAGYPTPDVPGDGDVTDKTAGPGASDSPGQPATLGSHLDAGTEEAPGVFTPATSNESITLVPGPQASAARAHVTLSHLVDLARTIMADIERFVPAATLQAARTEVQQLVRRQVG